MTDTKGLKAVLTEAFTLAIKKVGMGTFKATSMFASNHKAADTKKAA